MKRHSFVLYLDLLGSLDELSDAQAGKLFKAIKAYQQSVSEGATQDGSTEFDDLMNDFVTRLAFHPFRAAFERDAEKYRGIVERNRTNGKKGGRKAAEAEETQKNPKNPVGSLGSQTNPEEPKETQRNPNGGDNDNDNDNDNDIKVTDTDVSVRQSGGTDPAVPYDAILEFWNMVMTGKAIKSVSSLSKSSKRGTNVRARFKEHGLDKIRQAIIAVAESDFLNGRNDRGWVATFDWVFMPTNFDKVIDGNYANRKSNGNQTNDKFREFRGTDPLNVERKGFKGTL